MPKRSQNSQPATKRDVALVRQDYKRDVSLLKKDLSVVKKDVSVLKKDVAVLKQDVSILKDDVDTLARSMHESFVTKEEFVQGMMRQEQRMDRFEERIDAKLSEFMNVVLTSNDAIIKKLDTYTTEHAAMSAGLYRHEGAINKLGEHAKMNPWN